MSAAITTSAPAVTASTSDGLSWALRDTAAMTWRNLTTIRRVPQILVFSLIQPVIFVFMFRYVFGGAIKIPNQSYVNYLMPGIFTQIVSFGAINTAIGLAEDKGKGLLERSSVGRHRSQCIHRVADVGAGHRRRLSTQHQRDHGGPWCGASRYVRLCDVMADGHHRAGRRQR
jgi:ABC-2 type transporter